ncbi:MAG: 3' terminal RNA ribose 2'-O-methyltransferase Hen1 [Sporichthyaceae bacterium]
MLLTLSTTMPQAADLGYLVHKHPDRAQAFDTAAGTAHVFWPEASAERATVALLLEVDPIALVRGKGGRDQGFALAQYVNDRPYAASSMLSVALSKVFRTAMTGRCDARPELAAIPIPLEVRLPALPSRGGSDLVERLFAPLGWTVEATRLALDPEVPEWGPSRYADVLLRGELRVAEALSHLYVLMPVLDDGKHYWVSQDEIEKLMRTAGAWLPAHPERELITRRYLSHQKDLWQSAIARLAEVDDAAPESLDNAVPVEADEDAEEKRTPLAQLRAGAVVAALRSEGARSVVDLGCGEGALLRALIADPTFVEILGVEVSHRALAIAHRRLNFDRMPDGKRARIELIQSSATYRDDRLAGKDAVVLMEVIEHVDLPRLPALVRAVFAHARPRTVVVTTPNVEHNVRYEFLAPGAMRHPDHRFEWTRAEFRTWSEEVAAGHGYGVRYLPVGEDDPEVGPPTQLAVFRRST